MLKMRTVELAVGAFILAGIISFLMLALQVSGLTHFFKENTGYKVRAEFSNIGGLKVRAKVSMAGVMIGRVIDIKLDPQSFNATVVMAIDPKQTENIPLDSQASIVTAGLLGDNYISLVPGFDSNYLQEGSAIPLENTHSALVLEELVSRFMANKASGEGKEEEAASSEPAAANPKICVKPNS